MFVHNISPTLIEIGPFHVRYYGLMYIIGFTIAYFLLLKLTKERHIKLKKECVANYVFYIAVGAIIGARIFYCLIYNLDYYLANPILVFFIWQGGLSFHGGLIGAIISGYIFVKRHKLNTLEMADVTVIPLGIGLALGRIGNFINAELVGRATDVPWCVKFPRYDDLCRHPSQLYESAKNIIIFATLWFLRNKEFKKGTLFATFILMYSTLRFFIEFVREADVQLGYYWGLTMGQIINILMFIAGLILLYYVQKNES